MKERPKTTMGELTTRPGVRGVAVPATLRDAVMPIFRQRRLALLIFCGLFCGAVFGGFLLPRKYEAEMKILVNRGRVDAVVTADAGAAPAVAPVPEVTEEDLNSEVELLKSRDLLEQVVLACGLESRRGTPWGRIAGSAIDGLGPGGSDDAARLARSVQGLADHLIVDPLKKTTMIRVAYASRDPQLSARQHFHSNTVALDGLSGARYAPEPFHYEPSDRARLDVFTGMKVTEDVRHSPDIEAA